MNNNLHGSLEPDGVISGKLSAVEGLAAKLSDPGQLHGIIQKQKSYPQYTGETDIIPKAHQDQILETANKLVVQNIIVHEVPYEETHNESGTTVYIAKETETNG